MKKIQGTHIHLGTVDTDGTFSAFAFARQASVSMKRKMIQIASPTTGDSEEYIPGRKSWQMDCGCLLSNDESAVINAYNAGTKLKVAFRDETPDWSPELKYAFIGNAYIDNLKQQGNIHSMASFNISLQGTGALNYNQWEQNFTVAIAVMIGSHESRFRITTEKPLPCDVIFIYESLTISMNKGEQDRSKTFPTRIINYDITKWQYQCSIANYIPKAVENTNIDTPIEDIPFDGTTTDFRPKEPLIRDDKYFDGPITPVNPGPAPGLGSL